MPSGALRRVFARLFALLVVLIALSVASSAQTIDVTVRSLPPGKAALWMVSGDKPALLDSVAPVEPGRFVYAMRKGITGPGLYRLTFDGRRSIDFIHDDEDVTIETDAAAVRDSLRVIASEGNRLYNEFVRLSREYRSKSELLQLVVARYPHDDPFHATAVSTLSKLQGDYHAFLARASKERPSSFASRYIRSAQLPILDAALPADRHLEWLRAHALDSIDFADEGLIRSDVYAAKSVEYLSFYRNPSAPKEALEKGFEPAVDSILTRARTNELVYAHVTSYLIDGFKKGGFERIIDYILDTYVVKDDLCLDESGESAVAKMVEQKKLFQPGTVLPAIVAADSSGRVPDLKSMGADRYLVVFYAAACPHCRTMMPKLKELYAARKTKETEVIAVGVESNRAEWLGFVREQRLSWLSVSDLLGWNSPMLDSFKIYATPTMVVVDREMRVIAAPRTVDDARRWF